MQNRIWQGFLAFAKRVGQVQAWLLLTVFYVLVLAPVALIFRLSADPLRLRHRGSAIWHTKPKPDDRWRWARAQF